MRLRGVVLILVLCAAQIGFVSYAPSAQSAIYQCGPGPTNRFDGYIAPQAPQAWQYTEGASADIVVHFASVCTTDNSNYNFTTAWTMISDVVGVSSYAQSGFMRFWGDATMRHFVEYRRNANTAFVRTVCFTQACLLQDPSVYQYWIAYQPACGPCIQMFYNGTILNSTPFNPYTSWTQPFRPQFFGETTYLESDVPGSYAAPSEFRNLLVQRTSDDGWGAAWCYLTPRKDTSRWGLNADSCTHFWIWTY